MGDYELMVTAAAMARAEVATARGDHEGVLRALEPLVVPARTEIVEPGLWPAPDLYIDALVSVGKLAEADELLDSFEPLAATRGHAAVLARWPGRAGACWPPAGRLTDAEDTFERALATFGELAMPFHRAQVELTYGQALRRAGKRRAAATQLHAAYVRFRELGATPYLRRCEREMGGCGLNPARRGDFDPHRLTPQERAVARLVAMGMSNRQVAAELFVSVKTVQFHLTHVYTKLGVGSRAELAAHYRR